MICSAQNIFQCICYKRSTALKTLITYGLQNGRGYQATVSNYKSNKAGVYILFNNNFDFQIEKAFIDPQGRFIICDIKTNENCLTLANIYAPNEDNKAFFLDCFDRLTDFKGDDIIIIGRDYNIVHDLDKDKRGGLATTHQNSVKIIHEFSEKLD